MQHKSKTQQGRVKILFRVKVSHNNVNKVVGVCVFKVKN